MFKSRVAILIAVHNRWAYTQEIIYRLTKENDFFEICIHIVDDGSTDETQDNLESFPGVTLIRSNGNSYWAKSMKMAQDSVSESVDYFLWLNNDVLLVDEFYKVLYQAVQDNPRCILVGQTSDSANVATTYGGLRRNGRHPLRFKEVEALSTYEPADTFHGNIVLIPSEINLSLKGIDGVFQHGFADHDFGLRATKSSFAITVIPGVLGKCDRNPNPLLGKSRRESLQIILSVKFLPLKSQIRFCFRHGGPEWPIYAFSPYLKIILLNRLKI
jgi:GT2 family glycosyltransferase